MNTLLMIAMIAAILIFLILPGLKTRVLSVKKLIIMPAIFIYLNYDSLQKHFHIHLNDYFILMIGAIVGIGIGAYCRKNTIIRADHEKQLIEIAGSYFGLIMFIIIFAVHFAIGWIDSINPGYLFQASLYQAILMFLLTASSALSVGANAMLFYKYHKTNQSLLEK